MKQVRVIFLLCAALLAAGTACRLTAAAPAPTPTAARALPSAAASPTAPEASPTPVPTHTPRPPMKTATQSPLEPGQAVFQRIPLPDNETLLNQLWTAPDGTLWIAGQAGLFRWQAGWETAYAGDIPVLLGAGAQDRIWFMLPGGAPAYLQGKELVTFERSPGPFDLLNRLSNTRRPGYGFAEDALGRMWLAAFDDTVSMFDPAKRTWLELEPADLGYPPVQDPDYNSYVLTDVELSGSGKTWISACLRDGEILLPAGVMRSDNDQWLEIPADGEECVFDMEINPLDRSAWVGGFDAVLHYQPDTGTWTRLPLPPYERRQLVNRIDIDPLGRPWVEYLRYGGASPYGQTVIAHLEGEEWVMDMEPGAWVDSQVAFTTTGDAWICLDGTVYRQDDGWEEVRRLNGLCNIAIDNASRVWLIDENGAELWMMELE